MIYMEKVHKKGILYHCIEEYPKEACGILAGRGTRILRVYRMHNISEAPVISYLMQPEEQFKIFKEIRNSGLEMLGIYHSHPETPAYPSSKDCEMAFYPDAAYAIVSLSGRKNPDIRAFRIRDGKITEEGIRPVRNILFVCRENACRSQMAEAIVNNLYGREFKAYSAGSESSGRVNPSAVRVMREMGIDMRGQRSKGLDEVKDIDFDFVIGMGCGDSCPVPGKGKRYEWKIDDPRDMPVERFRIARDGIHEKIRGFIK